MEYIMQGVLMMNIGIYYFTRTGNCKRIAEKIADRLHLHPYILLKMMWTGKDSKSILNFSRMQKGKKNLNFGTKEIPGAWIVSFWFYYQLI